MVRIGLLAIVIAACMAFEARRAWANERVQRERGGIEPTRDVYPMMQVAYPGLFAVMLAEGLVRPAPPSAVLLAGVGVFAAGKLLKWWAIVSLGRCWTFRVIVVPGSTAVASGPYRYLRHPNYVGVAAEFAGTALVASAPVSGIAGTLLFVGLMALRVRIENRALDAILRRG